MGQETTIADSEPVRSACRFELAIVGKAQKHRKAETMRTLHVAGKEYQLHPFDVIIQPRKSTDYAWVGVYAVNDSHAIDLARQALGIHGPMYRVVDVENSRERYLGGDWQAVTWL